MKKFNYTTGVHYTTQFTRFTDTFTDTFAHLELSEFHNRYHKIFESVLDTITRDIHPHDQVRFVLQSPQLEWSISLPFMQRQRLTTERVLAKIERVIQPNREFRLNDTVNVNMWRYPMVVGARSEINLGKYLARKGSIVRIENKDELCLATPLVVAKAKIENDSRYYHIINHRRPLQKRSAQELHQKAGVPFGSCGMNEVKQFQSYLSQYQINIVSKEHHNTLLYIAPDQEKRIHLLYL